MVAKKTAMKASPSITATVTNGDGITPTPRVLVLYPLSAGPATGTPPKPVKLPPGKSTKVEVGKYRWLIEADFG